MSAVPEQQQLLSLHARFGWWRKGLLQFRSFCSKPGLDGYRGKGEKEKDLLPCDYHGNHSQAILAQNSTWNVFLNKGTIKQFNYSFLTKHGFLPPLVRPSVLSRAVSPLPPQGSHVSNTRALDKQAWTITCGGRQTKTSNCPSETGKGITEMKRILPVHQATTPRVRCNLQFIAAQKAPKNQ